MYPIISAGTPLGSEGDPEEVRQQGLVSFEVAMDILATEVIWGVATARMMR